MAYNQQLSVFSQFSPNTTGTAGQVLIPMTITYILGMKQLQVGSWLNKFNL